MWKIQEPFEGDYRYMHKMDFTKINVNKFCYIINYISMKSSINAKIGVCLQCWDVIACGMIFTL